MTHEEIIQVIADNFLCVRRLPFKVVSYWSYTKGDEERLEGFNGKPIYLEEGKTLNATREIVTGYWAHRPDKKFIKEVKVIEKGGWWYVKIAKNTSSTVMFNRKHDKFFGETLEEAIKLFLESKK